MENIILERRGANFFGFERIDKEGKRHLELKVIRGNGNLKLTDKGLYFSRWLPEKEIFIPIEKIKNVDLGMSHNGKGSWPAKVLKISFEENGGIKIFGVQVGRKLSLSKGWTDYAYEWKERIERMVK